MRVWVALVLLSGCMGGANPDSPTPSEPGAPDDAAVSDNVVAWANRTVYMQGSYDIAPVGRAQPGVYIELPGGEPITAFAMTIDWSPTPTATAHVRVQVFPHNYTTHLEPGDTWNQTLDPPHPRAHLSFAPVGEYGATVGGPDFQLYISVRMTGQAALD